MIALRDLIKENTAESTNELLLFYFTTADCYACIEKATLELIDFKKKISSTQVLAILKGEYFSQSIFQEFPHYLHDQYYSIENEIGFIPTPALIRYNNNVIDDIYLIPIFEDSIGMRKFINKTHLN